MFACFISYKIEILENLKLQMNLSGVCLWQHNRPRQHGERRECGCTTENSLYPSAVPDRHGCNNHSQLEDVQGTWAILGMVQGSPHGRVAWVTAAGHAQIFPPVTDYSMKLNSWHLCTTCTEQFQIKKKTRQLWNIQELFRWLPFLVSLGKVDCDDLQSCEWWAMSPFFLCLKYKLIMLITIFKQTSTWTPPTTIFKKIFSNINHNVKK